MIASGSLFSEITARMRRERNAARERSESAGREPAEQEREHDATEASGASESDLVAAILLAGARRRGEAPLAPPPPQPTPVAMTAEGIIAAGKKRRGEPVGGPK